MTKFQHSPAFGAVATEALPPAPAQVLCAQTTRVDIFTDGSCISHGPFGGFGGYAAVILRKNAATGKVHERRELSGTWPESTSNDRMEMIAVAVALESLGEPTSEPIRVICDANFIPNGMNGWVAGWRAKGWRRSNGQIPANRDLWDRIEAAAACRVIEWIHVKGHAGIAPNEAADKLAYAAAKVAQDKARRELGL